MTDIKIPPHGFYIHMSSSLKEYAIANKEEQVEQKIVALMQELNAIRINQEKKTGVPLLKNVISLLPRLTIIYNLLDGELAEWKEKSKDLLGNCSNSGCSGCCHQVVSCTDEEAILCLRAAHLIDFKIDMDKLKRQQGKEDSDFWLQSPEDSKCIFLTDKGLCGVYQFRPLICRLFFVKNGGDVYYPKETDKLEKPRKYLVLLNIKNEILAAAYTSLRALEIEQCKLKTVKMPTRLHTAVYEFITGKYLI